MLMKHPRGQQPGVESRIIQHGYDRKSCWVHARCGVVVREDGARDLVLTVQESAMGTREDQWDIFRSLHSRISRDGGLSWSALSPEPGLAGWEEPGDVRVEISDFTPQWHRASGQLLGLGHTCRYRDGALLPAPRPRQTYYSVFDADRGIWKKAKPLVMEEGARFFCCGAGSIQWWEEPDGTLLVPVYFRDRETCEANDRARLPFKVVVLRCRFEGEELSVETIGSEVAVTADRGLMEPSLVYAMGRYHLTLRGGQGAFYASSSDGLHFETPQPWHFDDGAPLESVDTQQHWLLAGERLFLVYTRRDGENDHVIRFRAPLWMAEVAEDPLTRRLSLIRESEQAVVENRGAQLGNFGVCQVDAGGALIVVSEWMESAGEWNAPLWAALGRRFPDADLPALAAMPGRCGLCELGGSDNALYLVRVGDYGGGPTGCVS